ncbi:MAG: cell division protein FtsL [Porticoccaceae bacterium]|jgi:cell division protein FtsL|nr:cell division protein FtsL [Porticoccaceae bacterium]
MSGSLRIGVLWLLVLSSALAVAFVSHVCRQKYDQLTSLEREKNQLQVAYGKFLLEQSAWGSLQRVETKAKDSLNMHGPQPQEIMMVKQ